MRGYFCLVIHTHMPYVRKNGGFPVGEDWLYKAMSRTYLPLLECLDGLRRSGLSCCLGVTLTPVLCEQLADPYIREKFSSYLDTMVERTEGDMNDFRYLKDTDREELAERYLDFFRSQKEAYERLGGDIVGALRRHQEDGLVEIISSAATHAFLQGIEDMRSVAGQVKLGVESYRRHIGCDPSGFWIPELAYRTGLEGVLEGEGLSYMLVDPSSIGVASTCPVLAGDSAIAAIARSDQAHVNAWDPRVGYPTDGRYLDTTKYYMNSGLLYWRVTGLDVPIEEKQIYDPSAADKRAREHARHFADAVAREISESPGCPAVIGEGTSCPPLPVVCASYDTEFFGYGWHEAFTWLSESLLILEARSDVLVAAPAAFIEANPPSARSRLSETTWTTGKDDSTWINTETEWMWEGLERAQQELFSLAAKYTSSSDPDTSRALNQAAREVLILEASDWPFMVARRRAKEYATQRFNTHLERFWKIASALREGRLEATSGLIAEIEEVDKIFTGFDLIHLWAG
jgi:1,4-alpha-glucan branching enzyme